MGVVANAYSIRGASSRGNTCATTTRGAANRSILRAPPLNLLGAYRSLQANFSHTTRLEADTGAKHYGLTQCNRLLYYSGQYGSVVIHLEAKRQPLTAMPGLHFGFGGLVYQCGRRESERVLHFDTL